MKAHQCNTLNPKYNKKVIKHITNLHLASRSIMVILMIDQNAAMVKTKFMWSKLIVLVGSADLDKRG